LNADWLWLCFFPAFVAYAKIQPSFIMVTDSELKYWVGFSAIPGIGRVRISQLREHFGSLQDAWKAPEGKLKQAGLDSRSIDALVTMRPRMSLDDEMEKLERYKVRVLTCDDPLYPFRLKEIYDYPPVLYVRGSLPAQDEPCLAVVGTRRPTIYGRQVTEEIVSDLARSGITVVSGLARGIDTVAHRTALDAGGKTMAVFGSGLDIVYPGENARLARDIMEHGALVSEYPLGVRPKAENFPLRNRIMSGLSLGVLVVEAGERSGALITAHQAAEQNREVFVVPGSILSPASQGTNRLIQEGAKLVRNYTDILEELNLAIAVQQAEMKEVNLTEGPEAGPSIESVVLKQLSSEPSHIDEICRRSGLSMPEVSSTLAMLELRGIARQVGSMNYVLAKRARE
jgi:DNA processing protein